MAERKQYKPFQMLSSQQMQMLPPIELQNLVRDKQIQIRHLNQQKMQNINVICNQSNEIKNKAHEIKELKMKIEEQRQQLNKQKSIVMNHKKIAEELKKSLRRKSEVHMRRELMLASQLMPLCSECEKRLTIKEWRNWLIYCEYDWKQCPVQLMKGEDCTAVIMCRDCKLRFQEFF